MSARGESTSKKLTALTGQRLVDRLHSAVGLAKQRLWIASPYVGAWKDVIKILGATWEKLDVPLLVDKESGFLSRDTMEKFAAHRPIRSLSGLHAKIYVIDDTVLSTSANLTGCAFRKRHEVGFLVDGPAGQPFISLYENFWDKVSKSLFEDIPAPKRGFGATDEPHGTDLPDLWALPRAPNVEEKIRLIFGLPTLPRRVQAIRSGLFVVR